MLKGLSYKVLLLTLLLSISLIVGITSNGYARPEPPQEGEYLAGPPIVGRLTLKLVSCIPSDCTGDSGILKVSAKFSGCCADCFTACKNSCNVKFEITDPLNLLEIPVSDNYGDGKLNLLDVPASFFEWFRLTGWGPKGCHSKNGRASR